MEALARLAFLDPTSLRTSRQESFDEVHGEPIVLERWEVSCSCAPGQTCAALAFTDGMLEAISIMPDYILSLGQVIGVLEDPDYVGLVPIGADAPGCFLEFYWIQRSVLIAAQHDAQDESTWPCEEVALARPIDPSLRIGFLHYMPPGSLDWIGNGGSSPWPIQRWPGLGSP
jgi:hypothetical protein